MILDRPSLYIIKQSNGLIWNFAYEESTGIIYRLLEENSWTDYQVVTDKGTKNFSVVLFEDDNIYVLYQDIRGHINLIMYDGEKWSEQQILKNEKSEMFHIYFNTTVYENIIHIIYSILNKTTGSGFIFHQALDKKNNLTNLKMIDRIKYDYQIPFNIYTTDNKEIFIMYQRLTDSHEIGYRIFNNGNWSNFYMIDNSIYPYRDYSMLIYKNNLYTLYIKDEQTINSLIYVHGSYGNFEYNKLHEDINIDSCSLLIGYNQMWCSWVRENEIYSSFSIDNGSNFSNPPYCQFLTSSNITKTIFRSNCNEDIRNFKFSDIYVIDESYLKYITIPSICPIIGDRRNNKSELSFIVYFMDKVHENILLYEKNLKQRNQYITQLKYIQKEQELKSIFYEKKFEEVNKEYNKFKEGKQLLYENINFLQKSLIDKEGKINVLENANIEEENEILHLREEIKSLKSQIEDLHSQLALKNTELSNSFFKRIFNK